jgi:hypothetical protein
LHIYKMMVVFFFFLKDSFGKYPCLNGDIVELALLRCKKERDKVSFYPIGVSPANPQGHHRLHSRSWYITYTPSALRG